MTDWTSETELATDARAFTKILFTFFGIYVWELFQTSDFEISILLGRRKLQWPMVFFFLCRYSILWSLVGLLIASSVTQPIHCHALYTFTTIVGQLAILTASTSLMIRTFILWKRKMSIVIPLTVLSLAQWGLIWRGMFLVNGSWSDDVQTCTVTTVNSQYLQATFFYTMAFDFVLLVAAGYQFLRQAARVSIWDLLFRDGLIFFIAASACNILPAIFAILDLNSVMNHHRRKLLIVACFTFLSLTSASIVHIQVPAGTVSAIAACRTVIQLKDLHDDIYTHTAAIIGGGNRRPTHFTRPVVSVKTEQFVMDDFGKRPNQQDHSPASRNSLDSSPGGFSNKEAHDTL
ncbi:uncharacterized protein STEHIDRAFT_155595 [Stereum hirsutum FP-91666 SS1]|uniref:uncharacterized protein n=1 Tax=Stereum hirsutum (strain FP-91666) TaxID=721885 RepID=UPI000440F7CC|nr:uncharacterized protein STEHIDRAFT_155595 [Stereum hirsutum FP-91666 SS1]EIM88245.1 hypothetical protein STEHIDRAFT_155595 [Stereum hirsutum FP-91666 SS1]